MSSRHLARSVALQSLYEWDFFSKREKDYKEIIEKNIKEAKEDIKDKDFIYGIVKGVVDAE